MRNTAGKASIPVAIRRADESRETVEQTSPLPQLALRTIFHSISCERLCPRRPKATMTVPS